MANPTGSGELRVVKPGLLTTVQDTGRPGHLHQGIAPSGAADNRAFRLSQRLVGNSVGQPLLVPGDPGAAGLEFTLQGPTVEFAQDSVACITGGRTEAFLDGAPVPNYQPFHATAGSILEIKRVVEGLRGYLSVQGGIDTPAWLGSRATLLSAGQGGHQGRALRAGDVLPLGAQQSGDPVFSAIEPGLIPDLGAPPILRMVISGQAELLEESSVKEFLSSEWKVTPQADRLAARLSGPVMQFKPRPDDVRHDAGDGEANVVDDVNPLGGIQVPGGAQAIVFGVDLTSTGGYAHIGTVISEDMSILTQLRPGQTLTFEQVDADFGVSLFEERERALAAIAGQ